MNARDAAEWILIHKTHANPIAYISGYHHLKGHEDNHNKDQLHSNLFVKSKIYPNDNHPLFKEVKNKILNWVDNLDQTTPKSNLSEGEIRGHHLVRKMVRDKKIFVTKADKGGAILVMNYDDVVNAVEEDLADKNNFEPLKVDALKETAENVKKIVLQLEEKGLIKEEDKTMITGLNKNDNMKRNAAYRAQPTYCYPLFKLHKLNEDEIQAKTIPPHRLVHAMKYGPLYRLEKWVSPYLTDISTTYCGEEFILDDNDLLGQISTINESGTLNMYNSNIHLFTIDVKALYPSINPSLALQALDDAILSDLTINVNTKGAVKEMTKFILEIAFISYKGVDYKVKQGIPTGGSTSRQMADTFLHWMLFKHQDCLSSENRFWELILLWRRFIDDILGIWIGTTRQFTLFMIDLNTRAATFVINFDKYQIGQSVEFLDTRCYLQFDEETNSMTIQYRLFKKPTDARRYLRTDSYHPPHTFKSVPKSQMLRVIKVNSKEQQRCEDLDTLIDDMVKCGYNKEELTNLKEQLLHPEDEMLAEELFNLDNESNVEETEIIAPSRPLIFVCEYFKDVNKLKSYLLTLKGDLTKLIGDTKIMIATRKGPSIGSQVMKNRQLGELERDFDNIGQKCGARNCKTCPRMLEEDAITANGVKFKLPKNVNCKSTNVIYGDVCQDPECVQNGENLYVGQTLQAFHKRNNGHRNCFNADDFEKSALSTHAMLDHDFNINFDNYKCAILKKTSHLNLDREEYKFTEKLRTNVLGLNRCKIVGD